jgi:hypothetical protein
MIHPYCSAIVPAMRSLQAMFMADVVHTANRANVHGYEEAAR